MKRRKKTKRRRRPPWTLFLPPFTPFFHLNVFLQKGKRSGKTGIKTGKKQRKEENRNAFPLVLSPSSSFFLSFFRCAQKQIYKGRRLLTCAPFRIAKRATGSTKDASQEKKGKNRKNNSQREKKNQQTLNKKKNSFFLFLFVRFTSLLLLPPRLGRPRRRGTRSPLRGDVVSGLLDVDFILERFLYVYVLPE